MERNKVIAVKLFDRCGDYIADMIDEQGLEEEDFNEVYKEILNLLIEENGNN